MERLITKTPILLLIIWSSMLYAQNEPINKEYVLFNGKLLYGQPELNLDKHYVSIEDEAGIIQVLLNRLEKASIYDSSKEQYVTYYASYTEEKKGKLLFEAISDERLPLLFRDEIHKRNMKESVIANLFVLKDGMARVIPHSRKHILSYMDEREHEEIK